MESIWTEAAIHALKPATCLPALLNLRLVLIHTKLSLRKNTVKCCNSHLVKPVNSPEGYWNVCTDVVWDSPSRFILVLSHSLLYLPAPLDLSIDYLGESWTSGNCWQLLTSSLRAVARYMWVGWVFVTACDREGMRFLKCLYIMKGDREPWKKVLSLAFHIFVQF